MLDNYFLKKIIQRRPHVNEETRVLAFSANRLQEPFVEPESLLQFPRNHLDIGSRSPADFLPEGFSFLILLEYKEMAFLDPRISEGFHTSLGKLSSCALLLVRLCNGQMVEVAASPVMAAQSRADNDTIVLCNKTHAGIAIQVGFDLFALISAAQPDIFGFLPEIDHFVIVVNGHRFNQDVHRWPPRKLP